MIPGSNPFPSVIGRYAVLDKIASGGMATVHLGRLIGDQGFSRVVAIKRLHRVYAQEPTLVSKFVDEARLAARVRHPNVVTALDVISGEGLLAVVLEYVHGETLADLARTMAATGARMPLPVAMSISVGMLEGLHAAHEATGPVGEPLGIVHRDVSPPNIIVGVDGVARVLDFGVAKATRLIEQTHGKKLKGKLAYMAPEQLGGEAVDRRTDVYSAAVVLWEMLTGTRLFAASNEAVVMSQVMQKQVPPPSALAAGVPAALDAIVLRGLARDAFARYPTAREMATALEAIVQPAPAREVGRWVESMAGAELRARSALVATLESATANEISTRARAPVPFDDPDDATIPYTGPPIEPDDRPLPPSFRDDTETVPFDRSLERPAVATAAPIGHVREDTQTLVQMPPVMQRLRSLRARLDEPWVLGAASAALAMALIILVMVIARC